MARNIKNKDAISLLKTLFLCFMFVFLLGYMLVVHENLSRSLESQKQLFEIAVIVNKKTVAPEVIEEKIRNMPDVASVKFVSREKAREKMAGLSKEIESADFENPFPDSYLVTPAQLGGNRVGVLDGRLRAIGEIDETRYDRKLLKLLNLGIKFRDITGLAITAAVLSVVMLSSFVIVLFFYRNAGCTAGMFFSERVMNADFAAGVAGLAAGLACFKLPVYFALKDWVDKYSSLTLAHGLILSACCFMMLLAKDLDRNDKKN